MERGWCSLEMSRLSQRETFKIYLLLFKYWVIILRPKIGPRVYMDFGFSSFFVRQLKLIIKLVLITCALLLNLFWFDVLDKNSTAFIFDLILWMLKILNSWLERQTSSGIRVPGRYRCLSRPEPRISEEVCLSGRELYCSAFVRLGEIEMHWNSNLKHQQKIFNNIT